MNVLYEEGGALKVGSVLADNTTSLQVESPHGKRTKVRAAAVLLRFEAPPPAQFLGQAEKLAQDMDLDFLWQCCGEDEFGFQDLAREYYGHDLSPLKAAAVLLKLHEAPMYFYKKGKGRYKAAPAEALKAALASLERKRLQAEQQARYVEKLTAFELPEQFKPMLRELLYRPDKASLEFKALEAACQALKLSPAHLLAQCGALPSSHDYHLGRFLLEYFPKGTEFPPCDEVRLPEDLPEAQVMAFSIDDVTTTEIDDAFSVERLGNGNLRVGIHIAAPALGIAPGSALDAQARSRLSTVYMPGGKITMLPEEVIHAFTLGEERVCPALSLYLEVSPQDYTVLSAESRVERVRIAANLRHDALERQFNEETLARGAEDYPFAWELRVLWELASRLEQRRGKAEGNGFQVDYNFYVENDRVTITERRRGSPIDKVVAELMIYANTEWGRRLAQAGIAAIYRAQGNGKVKMTTVPAPHQGLGVEQYAWATSPLRRYVDLLNQRQLIALLRGEAPPYARGSEVLMAAARDFELAYEAYGSFQRTMERYWCLRWFLQEGVRIACATVVREAQVKFDRLPLIARVPSAPPELPAGTRVELEVSDIDLLELTFCAKFLRVLAPAAV